MQRRPSRACARSRSQPCLGVVVGTIIGSGIFLVPAEMMQAVGSAKLVYLLAVGGLLSFFGALTYAELGAMKPQAGGEYVYVRDAYGPLGGFLYAWTWFVIANRLRWRRWRPDWCGFSELFPSFHFSLSTWSPFRSALLGAKLLPSALQCSFLFLTIGA